MGSPLPPPHPPSFRGCLTITRAFRVAPLVLLGAALAACSDDRAAAAKRDSLSRPSLPLSGYSGTYTDPWYGDVIIGQESGKLFIRFAHTPSLIGDLVHWQHDTFVARWRDRELRADAFVTFALNPNASIDQIKMQPVSESVDFSFDFQDLLLKPKPKTR